MAEAITLTIAPHDEVDTTELDSLTRSLRDEIAALDVDSAELERGANLPTGAKGDPLTVGSLVVSLASAGVFGALIELLKSWALRREGRSVTIKAEVDGRKLEMTFSPEAVSKEEMVSFAEKVMTTLKKK
jgi:hypothetical protein